MEMKKSSTPIYNVAFNATGARLRKHSYTEVASEKKAENILAISKAIDSLNAMVASNVLTISDARRKEVELKEKRIWQEFGISSADFGTYAEDGRAFVHIGADASEKCNLKSQKVTAKDKDELVLKLYSILYHTEGDTMNATFEAYHVWRFNVGTKSKTLKEDRYTWNRHFRDTIGNVPVKSVTISMVRDLFLVMTADNRISKTCFMGARGVLNGVFTLCCERGLIEINPVAAVSLMQFTKRFKPEEHKENYSNAEIVALVHSLRASDDPYDTAIRFAFNCCMRFGELRGLKFSDIQDNMVRISRSASDVMPAFLDEKGRVAYAKTVNVETPTKGATKEGIREFPLTNEAMRIVEERHKRHPGDQYIFTSNGTPLKSTTFNRHLQKACSACGIPYRSSHMIRFTNCDKLYFQGDVSKKSLQGYMGHSTPTMTDHYIAEHTPTTIDDAKVLKTLSIA